MAGETVKPTVPTSAPKVKDMTPEERERWYAGMRTRMGRSLIQVNGDPNKHYYWARKNDPAEMARLEWLGHEIVHDDPKAPRIKAAGLQQDGTYVLGDVILMQIDAEINEFLDMENARRARELIEGAKNDFVADAKSKEVPTFERDEKDPKPVVFHK